MHKRFIGFLTKYRMARPPASPFWLAPDRLRLITIGAKDDPASAPLMNDAKDIASELRGQMVRVSTDFGNNPIRRTFRDGREAGSNSA